MYYILMLQGNKFHKFSFLPVAETETIHPQSCFYTISQTPEEDSSNGLLRCSITILAAYLNSTVWFCLCILVVLVLKVRKFLLF